MRNRMRKIFIEKCYFLSKDTKRFGLLHIAQTIDHLLKSIFDYFQCSLIII